MATSTQIALPARSVSPLARWHLLSLDAPTVAALWTFFVARANHIRLPLAVPGAMAIAVWMLYATDRLLDARLLGTSARSTYQRPAGPHDKLEARHLFHHRHRRAFMLSIAIAATVLAALLPRLDPAAIPLYLIEGALLLAWFLILHATRGAHRLPKEIAVGLFFSAAIFIPTVAREPEQRLALLPSAILFAALCSLNCLFIYAWEHEDGNPMDYASPPANTRPAHATTRLALAHLTVLAAIAAIAAAALAVLGPNRERLPSTACALASLLLLLLHRNRRRPSRVNLRAAADLALLTPLLLLPILQ